MKKILLILVACGCIQLSGLCMDMLDVSNPASPLSPMNMINPASPLHTMLYDNNSSWGDTVPRKKYKSLPRKIRPYVYENRCLNSVQTCINYGGGHACMSICK